MRININKLLAALIYSNVVLFITLFIAPLVSYSISSKLYYEMNNKLDNKNDLIIPNVYNHGTYLHSSNTFEYNMKDLPVKNHLYGLPELNMYFACEYSLRKIQFLKIVEHVDKKHVRTNVVNVFCNKEFDYFLERKEALKRNSIFTRIRNYFAGPDFKDIPLETMDNLNYVNIKGDNSQYVTNANSVYSVQIDYLESKNIKLLTDSNISFNFNINNEILIKKVISKHPYLIKFGCFISVYLTLLVVISSTFLFFKNLNK
jgi:hypothetical protein